jgi:CRISPR-associated protein Cas1
MGGSRHSRNLIRQARLVSNDLTRLQVVVRMYCLRFQEPPDENLTLQQLRGKEGIRVRQAYADAAKATGITWQGRSYNRGQWDFADPVNRALSAGNACLYGLVHAAVISGGYSPALGFIHTGKQLSFIYDIADLYKAEHIIPMAFSLAASASKDLERQVRIACRDHFHQSHLVERILPDIAKVLDVPYEPDQSATDEYAEDAAKPSEWWQPEGVSADVPIGKILKVHPQSPLKAGEIRDGGDDPGTGETVSTG